MDKNQINKKIQEAQDDIEYLKEILELTTNDDIKELWEEDIKQAERTLRSLTNNLDEKT